MFIITALQIAALSVGYCMLNFQNITLQRKRLMKLADVGYRMLSTFMEEHSMFLKEYSIFITLFLTRQNWNLQCPLTFFVPFLVLIESFMLMLMISR